MTKQKPDEVKDQCRMVEELEELKRTRRLDDHQSALRRILRHRGNWRVKECALECVKALKEPQKELIQEACSIMCDEDTPPELRLRAVHLIRDFAVKGKERTEPMPYYQGATIIDKLKGLVGVPMHPILQRRIVQAIEEINKADAREV